MAPPPPGADERPTLTLGHASDPSPDALRIELLGGFRVAVGTRAVADGDWRRRSARAVIKLLALAPGHALPRERVMDALWPDLDSATATNNLRQALHAARRALDPTAPPGRYLGQDGNRLMLRAPGGLRVDVEAFTVAATAAQRTRDPAAFWVAIERYTGDLLPEDAYADWAADRREALRQEHLALLLAVAQIHEAHGEPAPASAALQRALAGEPAHEAAHRGLMRLYAATGQTDQALRQYQQLREALQRDLDTAPDPTSQRLYDEIVAGRVAQPQATAQPPSRAIESAEAPPRPAPDAPAPQPTTNLPAPTTSFIGRDRELAEIRRLLDETRLLTLTGVGGVGKSRLALEAARALQRKYADGAWLVELAALADPALAPQAVARAFGVPERPGRPTVETLVAWLAAKRLLLVLDNCEHLLDACASLADALLRGAPGVAILATSREPLRIAGETAWRAPALAVPAPGHSPLPAGLLRYSAVQLLVERARAAQPGFTITTGEAAAVAEICRRLDGLPLAIELAAARVRVLSVTEIAARLDDRFQLLTGGGRTALPRQQTLRATIDWSYALLSLPERALLRRLAVFVGGWTLAAAERVGSGQWAAGSEPVAESPDALSVLSPQSSVLDLLAQLVEKSLVLAEPGPDGTTRYRLLETVRAYARKRLTEAGDGDATRGRHADWCLTLAELAEPALGGPEQLAWLARLDAEQDNLRAALTWTLDREPEVGLRLAGCLWPFWRWRQHYSEGRGWLERLLERAPTSARWRAKALVCVGRLAREQGDLTTAHARLDESLALSQALAETPVVAWALRELADLYVNLGDNARARGLAEDALALSRAIGDPGGLAATLITLGRVERRVGAYRRARTVLEEGVALARTVGDRRLLCDALGWLGQVAQVECDFQRARTFGEESLAIAEELGDSWAVTHRRRQLASAALDEGDHARATALFSAGLAEARQRQDTARLSWHLLGLGHQAQVQGDAARAIPLLEEGLDLLTARADKMGVGELRRVLGLVVWRQGDTARATALLRESLEARQAMGDPVGIAESLEALAAVAADAGQAEGAARWLGAAQALRQTIGAPLVPVDQPLHEVTVVASRTVLGEAAFTAASATGRTLPLEHIIAEALTAALL